MRHKASWFVRSGLMMCVMISLAQAESISVKFADLDDYARANSPRAKIIEQEYGRTVAERDEDLQWSNPEIAYNREDIDQAAEYQITVGKRIGAPWVYQKKRSSWQDRVKSAELSKEQSTREHLATLRSGYVALWLLDEYLSRLGELKGTLSDASHVATARHSEGHLSGVEDHLVQMTVISLNASHQSALQERRELLASWLAEVGLEPAETVWFATKVSFLAVDLKPVGYYAGLIELQPEYMSKSHLAESFTKRAAAEKGKFIPSLNLYGGFKKVEPDLNGYVAGVSLSLPLFNRNSAAARQYQIKSGIARSELQLHRTQAIGRARALTESIAGSQAALSLASPHFGENNEDFSNLLFSYEEGWLTLNELLNAVQIETSGLEDYYKQLIQYYQNIFQLEAITGESLVSFEE